MVRHAGGRAGKLNIDGDQTLDFVVVHGGN